MTVSDNLTEVYTLALPSCFYCMPVLCSTIWETTKTLEIPNSSQDWRRYNCYQVYRLNQLTLISTLIYQDKFHVVLLASSLHQSSPELLERLWGACADAMYSLTERERQLGLGEEVS